MALSAFCQWLVSTFDVDYFILLLFFHYFFSFFIKDNKLRQPCSAGSIGCLCLIPAADGAEDKVITAGNDGICALHGVCNEDGFCEVDKKDVAISLATKIGIGLIFVGFHIVLNVF